jgi:hypothetical protein
MSISGDFKTRFSTNGTKKEVELSILQVEEKTGFNLFELEI